MDDLVSAVRMERWYPLAILILTALVQLIRKHPVTSPVWQKIPDGFRWAPGVVLGFATAFVGAYQSGAAAGDALLAGVGGIFGITIPSMGIAAGLRESHVPWDGSAGGKPKAVEVEV